MADETVSTAVDKAVETTQTTDKTTEKPVEKPTEKKTETVDDGLTEAEVLQARQLLAALKDPERATTIVDMLARQAGYTKIETKEDVKDAKKDITTLIKAELGDDLAFIADKLGPAISKILDQELEARITEHTKSIKESVEKNEQESLQQAANTTIAEIAREFFNADNIPDNVMDKMNSLMDEISPAPGMSVSRYVKTIFNSAVGELGLTKKPGQKSERAEKNRTDAAARLASEKTGKEIETTSTTKMSLDDAVKAAIEKANAEA